MAMSGNETRKSSKPKYGNKQTKRCSAALWDVCWKARQREETEKEGIREWANVKQRVSERDGMGCGMISECRTSSSRESRSNKGSNQNSTEEKGDNRME